MAEMSNSERHNKKRNCNRGLRKLCACARRNWPKCAHPWHFNFKPRGGTAWRFSLDAEVGRRLATKEEAETEAERIRSAIRAKTFMRAADRAEQEARAAEAALAAKAREEQATPAAITFETFAEKFVDNKAKPSGKKTWANDKHMFARLSAFTLSDGARFGAKPLGAITEDDLEAFYGHLRAIGRAASTRNQYVQVIKASFRWAAKKGYLTRSPISDDSTLKRSKIAQRARRLVPDVLDKNGNLKEPGEERRLLAAATPRLQNIIIAAIETAARRGELIALRWADVDLKHRWMHIRAETTKTGKPRRVPISDRLAAVLEMVRTDPAGKEYDADKFVFGDLGLRSGSIKRGWETAVLKAHGYDPDWQAGALTNASRAALRAINLHFHDLRHEGASRRHEQGWPLSHVQELLGHATIQQTSTYLNVSTGGLQDSMKKSDESARCNLVAKEATSGLPTDRNGDSVEQKQVTVN